MTEKELKELPEVNVVLWQDDDSPTTVTDFQGRTWFIGTHKGRLCKRRASIWRPHDRSSQQKTTPAR